MSTNTQTIVTVRQHAVKNRSDVGSLSLLGPGGAKSLRATLDDIVSSGDEAKTLYRNSWSITKGKNPDSYLLTKRESLPHELGQAGVATVEISLRLGDAMTSINTSATYLSVEPVEDAVNATIRRATQRIANRAVNELLAIHVRDTVALNVQRMAVSQGITQAATVVNSIVNRITNRQTNQQTIAPRITATVKRKS